MPGNPARPLLAPCSALVWSHATIQPPSYCVHTTSQASSRSRARPCCIGTTIWAPLRTDLPLQICQLLVPFFSAMPLSHVPLLAPLVRHGIACPDPQTRPVLVWPGSTAQSVPFLGGSTDVWPRRTGTGRVETPGRWQSTALIGIARSRRHPDHQTPRCSCLHAQYMMSPIRVCFQEVGFNMAAAIRLGYSDAAGLMDWLIE